MINVEEIKSYVQERIAQIESSCGVIMETSADEFISELDKGYKPSELPLNLKSFLDVLIDDKLQQTLKG